MKILETQRLILRTWSDSDAQDYLAINQDPAVLEFLPGLKDLDAALGFVERMNTHQNERGHALWAVQEKDSGQLVGCAGLYYVDFAADFTPAVEVGWIYGSQFWGKGYGTEAGKAALEYGFKELKFPEIVSYTVAQNKRSIRVMEKLGLQKVPGGDFDHPKVPVGDPLCRHVLYRVGA